MSLGRGIERGLGAQRVLGELVNGLVALEGWRPPPGDQQAGQERGGEQGGRKVFIRNSFLADAHPAGARTAKDGLSKESVRI